ncbi:MAG: HAD-IIIC family phosphatase, partial [Gemmatimonadaceae bacterium]
MNFLEASRIVANFKGGPGLAIRFAASGNVDPLLLYIRAAAAKRGRSAVVSTIPFGTLGQSLMTPAPAGEEEVILLLPWDFVPECDWRAGIPLDAPSPDALLVSARTVADRLGRRGSRMMFVPAPIPPISSDSAAATALATDISGLASSLGARFLPAAAFGLGNYLATGMPISGAHTNEVVETILGLSLGSTEGTAKVLVTDLDNVLWAGLAGEDGVEGIHCAAEGIGFRHFLYQRLLARLKASGVLLAAVSRNDIELARAPIVAGKTSLTESDFVAVLASFEPKSVHIARLAEKLNLGLDSFVFVDDNPVELVEVGAAHRQVRCVRFPEHDDELADFLNTVAGFFSRTTISEEDRERTEMYRRRLLSSPDVAGVAGEGADLTAFLAALKMELTIFDRTGGGRDRAVQLVNKT